MSKKEEVLLIKYSLANENHARDEEVDKLWKYQRVAIETCVAKEPDIRYKCQLIDVNNINKQRFINETILSNLKSLKPIRRKISIILDFVDLIIADCNFYDYLSRHSFSSILKKHNLVMIVSDVSYVLGSVKLLALAKEIIHKKNKITLFSRKGELTVLGKEIDISTKIIPINTIENEEEFKTYINRFSDLFFPGHYVSPSPSDLHIETYIDPLPIAQDDDCYQYIHRRFDSIRINNKYDMMVSVGITSIALTQLGKALSVRFNIPYHHYEDSQLSHINDEIEKGKKNIIIICDVIYSGKTVSAALDSLKARNALPVAIFTIFLEENGPEELEGIRVYRGCKLTLSVYKKDQCPYCKMGIRPIPLLDESSYRKYVITNEIRKKVYPREFWRMAKDSDAIENGHLISRSGKHYLSRINVEKLLDKYGAAVVLYLIKKSKLDEENLNIDYILYPTKTSKNSPVKLAKHFARVFEHARPYPIDKEDLANITNTGGAEYLWKKYDFLRGKKVIAVDDIAITLGTLEKQYLLTKYLDCRLICSFTLLYCVKRNEYESTMSKKFLEKSQYCYFYRYPYSPARDANECAKCIIDTHKNRINNVSEKL